MQKQINELMNDPQWIATETAVMKKKHYFVEGSDESLCGKTFDTTNKVRGETLRFCEECKKILLNQSSIKEKQEIKLSTEVAI